jgi:phosphoserine phosphatase
MSMPWYRALALELDPGDHAVFDADGTLWHGDVGEALQEALIAEGSLPADVGTEYERLLQEDYREAYAFATRALAGLSEEWLRARCAAFFAEWEPRVFPEMRGLVAELATRGVHSWIASGSNRWIVECGAASFGIPAHRTLAMTVDVEAGVLTDRLRPPPLTAEGKADAVRAALPIAPALVAGNSVADLATLRMATRRALVVNAMPGIDPRTGDDLVREAHLRGWSIRELF